LTVRGADAIGILCDASCVPLALGVFGVLNDLLGMGWSMTG
jgi:hypothetical protein